MIQNSRHTTCRPTFDAGWNRMVELVADAVRFHAIHEKSLRLTLADIAKRSYGDGAIVNQALEEGWKQGMAHSMADGILTQAEEAKLREFRDQLALANSGTDREAAEQLERAATDRLTLDARLAAIAVEDADPPLEEVDTGRRPGDDDHGRMNEGAPGAR